MSWLLLAYNILLTTVVFDALASTFAAVHIFRLRQRFGKRLAKSFLAQALESWGAILGAAASPTPARIIIWVTVLRILLRLYKTDANIKVALFLLGYINGDHPEVMKDQKPQ